MRIIIENADSNDFNELAKLARQGKIHTFCMTDEEEKINLSYEQIKKIVNLIEDVLRILKGGEK